MATRILLFFFTQAAEIQIHEKAGAVSFPGKVCKQNVYEQLQGFIEYVLVMPKGKEYESLFVASIDAVKLSDAIKKVGVMPGRPSQMNASGRRLPPEGGKLRIWVEWKDEQNKDRRERIETFTFDVVVNAVMEPTDWVFTGSKEGFDIKTETTTLQAAITKNLIGFFHADASVLIQNPKVSAEEHRYKPNLKTLPKEGTPVRIVFEAVK